MNVFVCGYYYVRNFDLVECARENRFIDFDFFLVYRLENWQPISHSHKRSRLADAAALYVLVFSPSM